VRSLIIGDPHNKVELVEEILKGNEKKCDEIILMGDYFDDYGDNEKIAEKTAKWLKEKLQKPNRIHLWGNHDLHYRYPKNIYINGTGFTKKKSETINSILNWDNWNKLKYYHISQGFVFSHAGFHIGLLSPILGFDSEYIDGEINYELENLRLGLNSPIFGVGEARRGYFKKGGITWLDWEGEFEPLYNVNQIVGHSHSIRVRKKGENNYCVDCFPDYIIEIKDGVIKEIKLGR
jgi:hypothetical protein